MAGESSEHVHQFTAETPDPVDDKLAVTAVTATPRSLDLLRSRLTAWVARTCLSAHRAQDLVLAVYEATANVVVHAYRHRTGTFDLLARHNELGVTITITDHGRWQRTTTDKSLLGGRGLPMMRMLADQAAVDTGIGGTTVRMSWVCPAAD